MKSITNNKKAYFDYEIKEKIEAGIVLEGWEVKSIKNFKISLAGSYIKEVNGEIYLIGSQISAYKQGRSKTKEEENRDKKLLLKKREALNLIQKAKEQGYTIVPLEVYINNGGIIKVSIGLAKGKKKFDKREKLKRQDLQRRVQSERKHYNL